jgi:hypothetical protein
MTDFLQNNMKRFCPSRVQLLLRIKHLEWKGLGLDYFDQRCASALIFAIPVCLYVYSTSTFFLPLVFRKTVMETKHARILGYFIRYH